MRLKVIKDSYLATEIFFPFVYMFLKRVYGMESIKGVTKIIHSFSNSFNMGAIEILFRHRDYGGESCGARSRAMY